MKPIVSTKKLCTLNFLLFIVLFLGISQITAQTNRENEVKLNRQEINTPNGKITIFLPANIVNGDVISGTVVSEPKGNTTTKQQQNSKIIKGYVYEIGENKNAPVDDKIKFTIPDDINSEFLDIFLRDQKGKIVSTIEIPVAKNAPFNFPLNAMEKFSPIIPEYIESGVPTSIAGYFDGDFSTSAIQIADKNVDVLAESPREIIFNPPENISGIENITIEEQGLIFEEQIRIIDLQLSAAKTQLKTGEQTSIQMVVSGLIDIDSDLKLFVNNLTPSVLLIEGGNFQELIISPENVNDQGVWTGAISGNSIRTGDFSVQVKVEQPQQQFIVPVYPAGKIETQEHVEFIWNPINIPENVNYKLLISVKSPGETNLILEVEGINQSPFILPNELPELNPGEVFIWQIQTEPGSGPGVSSPTLSWEYGPVAPQDNRPGEGGDPCEDPKYVENEEKQCAEIVDEMVNKPFHTGPELDFDSFKDDWQEYFRQLSQTILQFDLQLSMIKYWIGAGDEIDQQAQDVQKLAGIIKNGIGKSAKAIKEGSEEALKEMAEDKVKEFQQYAVGQVSETLGALYDLEDLAIRRIGLGIAKGITGVYPDKMADHYRRQLQITTTSLSEWIANSRNRNTFGAHPTLQDGIEEMCDFLNQLDQIEEDFEKAVEAAGFICIECEIPDDLKEEMEKLRQDIEAHIRMFGDTIDQIRQRLVEARSIANNKKAYEDIARLGSFQANSAKQTSEINKVLTESRANFEDALKTRKQ